VKRFVDIESPAKAGLFVFWMLHKARVAPNPQEQPVKRPL
jgi:hypothetical protein